VIERVGRMPARRRRTPQGDHYAALLRSIIGQQLSVKAAASIYARVIGFYGGAPPTPEQIIATDPLDLRSLGLSHAKAAYLRSLAEHVLSGELELARLESLDDATIIAELTAVKGLGEWTAQMFLMFQLERPDVMPVGDLGIRRAVERWWSLPEMPRADELLALAEPWRPYRTLAARYLWTSLDAAPV